MLSLKLNNFPEKLINVQFFEYTTNSEIRFNSEKEMCMSTMSNDDTVTMLDCPADDRGPQKSQQWEMGLVRGGCKVKAGFTRATNTERPFVNFFNDLLRPSGVWVHGVIKDRRKFSSALIVRSG